MEIFVKTTILRDGGCLHSVQSRPYFSEKEAKKDALRDAVYFLFEDDSDKRDHLLTEIARENFKHVTKVLDDFMDLRNYYADYKITSMEYIGGNIFSIEDLDGTI